MTSPDVSRTCASAPVAPSPAQAELTTLFADLLRGRCTLTPRDIARLGQPHELATFTSALRSPELDLIGALVRSQDSKVGNAVEEIFFTMLERYGPANQRQCPEHLWGYGVCAENSTPVRKVRRFSSGRTRTAVLSDLAPDLVNKEAAWVQHTFVTGERTTRRLCELLAEAHDRLEAAYVPGAHPIRACELDSAYYVLDNVGEITELRLCEFKLKGQLDSTKNPAEFIKLLSAVLLLGRRSYPVLPTGACVENVDTATMGLVWPKELYLVGAQLWEQVLPAGVSYAEMLACYCRAAEPFQLQHVITELVNDDGSLNADLERLSRIDDANDRSDQAQAEAEAREQSAAALIKSRTRALEKHKRALQEQSHSLDALERGLQRRQERLADKEHELDSVERRLVARIRHLRAQGQKLGGPVPVKAATVLLPHAAAA